MDGNNDTDAAKSSAKWTSRWSASEPDSTSKKNQIFSSTIKIRGIRRHYRQGCFRAQTSERDSGVNQHGRNQDLGGRQWLHHRQKMVRHELGLVKRDDVHSDDVGLTQNSGSESGFIPSASRFTIGCGKSSIWQEKKHEARICVLGNSQRPGLDYGKVFSPVTHKIIASMILSIRMLTILRSILWTYVIKEDVYISSWIWRDSRKFRRILVETKVKSLWCQASSLYLNSYVYQVYNDCLCS